VTQIAVTVDPACEGVDYRKVAFWCSAIDAQAEEFCQAWSIPYTPVNFYSTDVLFSLTDAEVAAFAKDSRLLTIQPSLDVSGALGYHDDIAGVIFARVMWQGDDTSVTISHEVLEELGDPTCDLYLPMGDGRLTAVEACDAVEGDTYIETGYIADDAMPVAVSNWLFRAWFEANSPGPWDRMRKLIAALTMTEGGYMIVRQSDGTESEVFAQTSLGHLNASRKMTKPMGRTARRMKRAA
jgi:hypothetical protein